MKLDKKKAIILSIGIVIGAIGGFLYWRFVGCTSGSCAITSNWHTSSLVGGVFGYLISDSIKVKKNNEDIQKAQ